MEQQSLHNTRRSDTLGYFPSHFFRSYQMLIALLAYIALFMPLVADATTVRSMDDILNSLYPSNQSNSSPLFGARSGITISGISSGAFMSTQVFVAYSSLFDGIASIAGGPYYAAQGNVLTALHVMQNPQSIDVKTLIQQTDYAFQMRSIDSPLYMLNKPAYIYTGTLDTVVHPGVSNRLKEYLNNFKVQTTHDSTLAAEHAMPTKDYGRECSYRGTPFINSCNFDGAARILSTLGVGNKNKYRFMDTSSITTTTTAGNYYVLDQAKFSSPDMEAGLESYGLQQLAYAYVPEQCKHHLNSKLVREAMTSAINTITTVDEDDFIASNAYLNTLHEEITQDNINQKSSTSTNNAAQCDVHVVLHGCKQTLDHIQTTYIKNAGYNKWADELGVIMLYPQAKIIPLVNPEGCWDWWGYTGMNYATRSAPQIFTIASLAQTVKNGIKL